MQERIAQATQLLQQGQSRDAEAKLREAVQIAPNNATSWELLSELYWRVGNFKEAQPALERLLQLEPDSSEARMHLAQCLLKNEDRDGARRLAEDQLQRDANNIAALQMLANLDKGSDQSSARLQRLQRLVDLQPQNAFALCDLVDQIEALGNFEQAIPLADRLVKLAPKSPSSFYLRGVAFYTVNKDDAMLSRAKEDFQKILQLSPNDSEGHRFLGRVLLRRNEPQKAIAQFEAVGRGRPFATLHYLEMAQAYRRAGNIQRANELQGVFTSLKGFNSRIESGREQLHVHPDSTTDLLNMATILSEGVQEKDIYFQLLRFRLLQGRVQSASFYLHKALALNPKNAQIQMAMHKIDKQSATFCGVAETALQHSNKTKACANIFRALLLRPESPRTRQALKKFTDRHIDPLGTLPPPPASTQGLVSPTKL